MINGARQYTGIQVKHHQMGDADADSTTFPQSRTKNGKTLYRAHCGDCHGQTWKAMMVPLCANPILTMESAFIESVRQGRGGRPHWSGALSSQELADIQAWLQTAR